MTTMRRALSPLALFAALLCFAAPASAGVTVTVPSGESATYTGDKTITGTLAVGGAATLSANGAASTPVLHLNGSVYSAGTATTNFPKLYLASPGATAPTTLSTGGTVLGANSTSGFAGDFFNFFKGGVSKASLDKDGRLVLANNISAAAGTIDARYLAATNGYLLSTNTNPGTQGQLLVTGTVTNTGSQAQVQIYPTYNQTSGTAANTDLLINRTETAVGSGAQLLIDAQVGGVKKFSVTNTGSIDTAGNINLTATAPTISTTVGNSPLKFIGKRGSAAGNAHEFTNSLSASASSGDNVFMLLSPRLSHTGTAAASDFVISRTETSLGSGAQKFISLQSGAAEMWAVSNKGIITESISPAITADSGSAQGGSPLTSSLNVITVVATAGDSVTLPTAAAGVKITITNRDAADSADVFPASGDSINGGAGDAAKALAAAATMQCFAVDATSWECLTLAR